MGKETKTKPTKEDLEYTLGEIGISYNKLIGDSKLSIRSLEELTKLGRAVHDKLKKYGALEPVITVLEAEHKNYSGSDNTITPMDIKSVYENAKIIKDDKDFSMQKIKEFDDYATKLERGFEGYHKNNSTSELNKLPAQLAAIKVSIADKNSLLVRTHNELSDRFDVAVTTTNDLIDKYVGNFKDFSDNAKMGETYLEKMAYFQDLVKSYNKQIGALISVTFIENNVKDYVVYNTKAFAGLLNLAIKQPSLDNKEIAAVENAQEHLTSIFHKVIDHGFDVSKVQTELENVYNQIKEKYNTTKK